MKTHNRRDFLKTATLAGASVLAFPALTGCAGGNNNTAGGQNTDKTSVPTVLLVPKNNGLPITGTFLDEISHDIPHQNWGEQEWDRDFQYMKAIGIDTVIMIRSGYRKFITYPSAYLIKKGCYTPSVDLLDLFLRLAAKHGLKFYFGLYDSGKYWDTGDLPSKISPHSFSCSRTDTASCFVNCPDAAITAFHAMGKQCKDVSGGLPTFISPWIDGKKAVKAASGQLRKQDAVSGREHEKEWGEIFDGIKGTVDACAFQDGHIDYDELDAFFEVNKRLADRYGMQCWTNAETFDRDMRIKFLPIKFDKLRMKLEAAKRNHYDKAITLLLALSLYPEAIEVWVL